jgi:hypothetical protein
MDTNVLKWLKGDLSFLSERTKEKEDAWGRSLTGKKGQWTGPFGEELVKRILEEKGGEVRKPEQKGGFIPDFETDDAIWEVKTQTYLTTGTAGEKILGVPFKYCEVPALYSKPLFIVCVGAAEHLARDKYKVWSDEKRSFVSFTNKTESGSWAYQNFSGPCRRVL